MTSSSPLIDANNTYTGETPLPGTPVIRVVEAWAAADFTKKCPVIPEAPKGLYVTEFPNGPTPKTPEGENAVHVTRVYSYEGETYYQDLLVPMTSGGTIGTLSAHLPASAVIFRETPSTYDFKWHVAPRRQYVVNLSAPVDIEVCSGERRVLPAGTVFLLEDLEGKGHQSRSVNGLSRLSLFIAAPEDK